MLEKNRNTAQGGERITDTAAGAGASYCGVASSHPLTVRENLNRAIETHNRAIAQLIMLRDTTPGSILDMPQPNLAALVYPEHGF